MHQVIRADASQVEVNDDYVRARPPQRDESRRASRYADDGEASLFELRTVGCDRRLVGHQKDTALIARSYLIV
jgi:hypothetical protein